MSADNVSREFADSWSVRVESTYWISDRLLWSVGIASPSHQLQLSSIASNKVFLWLCNTQLHLHQFYSLIISPTINLQLRKRRTSMELMKSLQTLGKESSIPFTKVTIRSHGRLEEAVNNRRIEPPFSTPVSQRPFRRLDHSRNPLFLWTTFHWNFHWDLPRRVPMDLHFAVDFFPSWTIAWGRRWRSRSLHSLLLLRKSFHPCLLACKQS